MHKQYKIVSAMHIEDILDEINDLAKEGWELNYILQEHAYSKVILEKEIP